MSTRQHASTTHDYLAVIFVAGGSSWGRSPDKEQAIKRAMASFRDWEQIFRFDAQDISVHVTDVQGYGDCWWDHSGMHGTNLATGKTEKIDRTAERVERPFVPSRRKAG